MIKLNEEIPLKVLNDLILFYGPYINLLSNVNIKFSFDKLLQYEEKQSIYNWPKIETILFLFKSNIEKYESTNIIIINDFILGKNR